MPVSFSPDDLEPVTDAMLAREAFKVPASATDSPTGDAFFDEPEEAPVAKKTRKAPKVASRSTTPAAAVPAVIAKMRSVLKVDRPHIHLVPLYMDDADVPTFTVGLTHIRRADTELVAKKYGEVVPFSADDPERPVFSPLAYDTVSLALSIATLDDGHVEDVTKATPVWKALEVEPEAPHMVLNPLDPHQSVRAACVDILFQLLQDMPTEITSTLIAEYKMHVVPKFKTEHPKSSDKPENPTTRKS